MLDALREVPLPDALVFVAALGVPPLMLEMWYHHYRGNFHRAPMYAPVVVPTLFAAAAFLHLGVREPWARWTFAAACALLLLMACAGAFFHVQGTARQTGGFNLDNLMVGPPVLAPLSFAMLAVLGIMGLLWGVA